MDLKHKHWALIIIGILVAAFAALAVWYIFGNDTAMAPSDTATSTIPVATTTAAGPAHITDHGTYYDIDLTYPSATPLSAEANMAAVAAMRAKLQDEAAEFKKAGDFSNLTKDDIQLMGLDQRKMSLESKYASYTGTRTVSYVFQIYEDMLGAHPNTYYRTFTFDTRTGKQLELGDLFSTNDYPALLSDRSRVDLPQIIKKLSGGYDADQGMLEYGTTPEKANFEAFYIKGSTLTIVFAPYQVGPYALGTVELPIPLSQLSSSLKAEYK